MPHVLSWGLVPAALVMLALDPANPKLTVPVDVAVVECLLSVLYTKFISITFFRAFLYHMTTPTQKYHIYLLLYHACTLTSQEVESISHAAVTPLFMNSIIIILLRTTKQKSQGLHNMYMKHMTWNCHCISESENTIFLIALGSGSTPPTSSGDRLCSGFDQYPPTILITINNYYYIKGPHPHSLSSSSSPSISSPPTATTLTPSRLLTLISAANAAKLCIEGTFLSAVKMASF